MELNRCSRCGNFHITEGDICPKCCIKDGVEFSTFQSYVQENGFKNSFNTIAHDTGISVQNLNRFITYPEFQDEQKDNDLERYDTNGKCF